MSETDQSGSTSWTERGSRVKQKVKKKIEDRIQTSKLPANHTIHWFALIFLQLISDVYMKHVLPQVMQAKKKMRFSVWTQIFLVEVYV